eukprot:gene10444-2966_t
MDIGKKIIFNHNSNFYLDSGLPVSIITLKKDKIDDFLEILVENDIFYNETKNNLITKGYKDSQCCVYLIKNNNSYDERPRSGRPKEYSDEIFISYITKYPTKSPKERHDIWKKDDPKNARSLSTIEKWDQKHRVIAHHQRFKHLLTDVAKKHIGKNKKRSVL